MAHAAKCSSQKVYDHEPKTLETPHSSTDFLADYAKKIVPTAVILMGGYCLVRNPYKVILPAFACTALYHTMGPLDPSHDDAEGSEKENSSPLKKVQSMAISLLKAACSNSDAIHMDGIDSMVAPMLAQGMIEITNHA